MAQNHTVTDKNLWVDNSIGETDAVLYDVRERPFEIYGLYSPLTEPEFKRMPDDIAASVSPEVATLARNTAGGRIRFSSDSMYVAIRAEMYEICRVPHMPLSGSAGFDLYIDVPGEGSRFRKSFMPSYQMKDGYESKISFYEKKMRYFTINLPPYSGVKNLQIALQKGATVGEGLKYRNELPVVFYGSSITQGACASRPGNSYQNILSRRLNLDYLNFGFSGAGKAEEPMLDYLASLPMMAFVCDYDHNAGTVEYLRNTHLNVYKKIRAAHPDIPFVMISRSDFDCAYDENILRRDVIIDTYRYARAQGDRNVYYVDGASIYRGPYAEMCTIDGVHPGDLGFALIADAIGAELSRAFTQNKI